MRILVTGGAGYIGSHTLVDLAARGHQLHVVDNFSNASPKVFARLAQITGQAIDYTELDICDEKALSAVFANAQAAGQPFEAVIHFAGLKAVGESQREPLRYYHTNVQGSLVLLRLMQQYQVHCLVFSSSATVYGDPVTLPLTEQSPCQPQSVYGRSKYLVEQLLADWCLANPAASAVILRYFNPVGAHPSGLIGEDPQGIPNNLLPFISQVAVGRRAELQVFGQDYPTVDGTGVRDYIHVQDLARGHSMALEALHQQAGTHVFNLGTGQGISVLQMVEAFANAANRPIPLAFAPRRPGDVAACYANASKARRELQWQAVHSVHDMVQDTWRWQQQNPAGYLSSKDSV